MEFHELLRETQWISEENDTMLEIRYSQEETGKKPTNVRNMKMTRDYF